MESEENQEEEEQKIPWGKNFQNMAMRTGQLKLIAAQMEHSK